MHKAAITITDCIRFLRIEHHITASQAEKRKVNSVFGFLKKKPCYSIQEVVTKKYLKKVLGIQYLIKQIFSLLSIAYVYVIC